METLKEIKYGIAVENGYKDFDDVIMKRDESYFINEIAKRYAKECVKLSLEKASKTQVYIDGHSVIFTSREKEAIKNTENIVLP